MTNNVKLIALLTVFVSFCWYGCQKEINDQDLVPAIEAYTKSTVKTGTEHTYPCEMTWNLYAGRLNIDIGSVSVTNDADYIYVSFKLDYQDVDCIDNTVDAEFGTLYVWIGNDLTLIDHGGECRPTPGRMAEQDGGMSFDASGLTEHTFKIPWDQVNLVGVRDICNKDLLLNVVAHAEVTKKYCDGTVRGEDIAFGGEIDGPTICGSRERSWWFYDRYTVCCGDMPPQEPFCETAFAKGGWVWTTGKKSNPDNLSSLELTKNRWGWAIQLEDTGETTYDIWAGAGLNDISKGMLVGVLSVNWDGSNAIVTYTMDAGYCMEEVHLYAEDTPPTTIAPGQYGNTKEFDSNKTEYTFEVSLEDADRDGVWLIAHAVVCNECR